MREPMEKRPPGLEEKEAGGIGNLIWLCGSYTLAMEAARSDMRWSGWWVGGRVGVQTKAFRTLVLMTLPFPIMFFKWLAIISGFWHLTQNTAFSLQLLASIWHHPPPSSPAPAHFSSLLVATALPGHWLHIPCTCSSFAWPHLCTCSSSSPVLSTQILVNFLLRSNEILT